MKTPELPKIPMIEPTLKNIKSEGTKKPKLSGPSVVGKLKTMKQNYLKIIESADRDGVPVIIIRADTRSINQIIDLVAGDCLYDKTLSKVYTDEVMLLVSEADKFANKDV